MENERKSAGLPVRTNNPIDSITGDDPLFRTFIVTPQEPFLIGTYRQNNEITKPDGSIETVSSEYNKKIPHLVSTMALGNLITPEVRLARIWAEMARILEFNGYEELAINYYTKIVHLNVTSQSHLGHLLQQILSESVTVHRKEESVTGTRNYEEKKPNKLAEIFDKWKNKDGSELGVNNNQQGQYQNIGMR